jgi:hypothetical protein
MSVVKTVKRRSHQSYLNVGYAEAGDGADLRTRNTRRLEGKHGLEVGLQICYGR